MEDIEELYIEFQSELNIACWSFYTWKNIHNIATGDKKIHHALNKESIIMEHYFIFTAKRFFQRYW